MAVGFQNVIVDDMTITAPPDAQATSHCARYNLFGKRDSNATAPSCSFGACGTTCLTQGSFCCNPGGVLAIEPQWICDNGACVTSVRGAAGVVDCFDPDNPSGTTQSCIDNVATAVCAATDRCYTCETDVPFCHWQTYVAPGSPTLRWFSCISTSTADETFFATSVTNNLLPTAKPHSSSSSSSSLSTNAIIGIAVAGAVTVIVCVAILAWCCLKRRKTQEQEQDSQNATNTVPKHDYSPVPAVYYKENRQELPDDDPQSQAYNWRGGKPTEAASTPVAELPGERLMSPAPQFVHREQYDEHGFLHEDVILADDGRSSNRAFSPGQETLTQSPPPVSLTPGHPRQSSEGVSSHHSLNRVSPEYTTPHSAYRTPMSRSPMGSPGPPWVPMGVMNLQQQQEYFPPPVSGSASQYPPSPPARQNIHDDMHVEQDYITRPRQGGGSYPTVPPGHYAPNGTQYGL